MRRVINVAELKNRLCECLDTVERGDELVICKRNVPVARLTALPARRNRTRLGFDAQRVRWSGDVCAAATGAVLPLTEPKTAPEVPAPARSA
jgi:prevent-host-death family protein